MEWCWPLSGWLSHCQAYGTTSDGLRPRKYWKGRSAGESGGRVHGANKVCGSLLQKGTCSCLGKLLPGLIRGGALLRLLGAGLIVSKQGGECWCCTGSHMCPCIWAGVGREKWHCQLFCCCRSFPAIPASPAYTVRLVNKSTSHIPLASFKLLLCAVSQRGFLLCRLSKGRD